MKRVPRPKIETELGTEILCSRCGLWPADGEFFYTARGKLHPWCKACYLNDEKVIQKAERWKESLRSRRAMRAVCARSCRLTPALSKKGHPWLSFIRSRIRSRLRTSKGGPGTL